MIENCLRHKIIRDFLRNYTENRWKDLIPSLIQIGILNLQKSFNKIFFTNEEIKNVLRHLQISQIEKDKERNKEKEKEKENKELKDININKEINIKTEKENNDYSDINLLKGKENDNENKYFKYQTNPIETSKCKNGGDNESIKINIDNNIQRIKILDLISKNNQEKIRSCNDTINEMRTKIKNNYHYFKDCISTDLKNKLIKQRCDHYKKVNIEQKNKNMKSKMDKISYAISYDKDLRPESISKKINQNNNTNYLNTKTEYDIYNSNYSSEKKYSTKNNSKSKSKNKNKKGIKGKYSNMNINNYNRIVYMQNIKRKHYNIGKKNIKNELSQNEGKEKNKIYKKISTNHNCNLLNNEANNNYHVVKIDKILMNKIKTHNLLSNKASRSYNSYYNRNLNFINTLYQKVNSYGLALKNNNYFSNRDEMDEFIKQNQINYSKLNIKNDIIIRKNITKSVRPADRKNNFMNMDENSTNKDICYNSEKNKSNEVKRIIKTNSFNKINLTEEDNKKGKLITKFPTDNNFIKLNIDTKTPKNDNSKKNTISVIDNKVDKIDENINIDNILNTKKETDKDKTKDKTKDKNKDKDENTLNKNAKGLKTIKLFEKRESNNNTNIKNNFEKANGKNGEYRYFNVFGPEGDDISLTQFEKDCSGFIDSSTSNEIQLNPDCIFKESPLNVFKGNKSDQSNNSINNEM